ncbi:aminotransferase class I/II-fold pyridoxal phosphate-dependent enzyme [Virgibacillus sp. 179-BFC.A HS]|uniref:Aminotransferase class I/II-fold pyridoxal phosphate-dependent enzyme n=1 Tax=Tigheibacillus jepli TaxID=3035914 RepID=A0ABU5CLP7_9BACI|nr:aminotransferase class I/II-fold pyridoxal phosphate-dependent enzyme [Virgibacillus sp. 179-BFC.A HS]MDY0406737.1 aminotransferase class I/II-fold pyridoxal phosphate-dependent enzyme [Virgibacillus sp. 179-BFC.A HS]
MSYDASQLKYAASVIPTMTVRQAQQLQFKLTDTMSSHFSGDQFLSLGDLGVAPRFGKPEQTQRVECTLADLFGAEKAALVRGAGTGAIRGILSQLLLPGDCMFIHTAPVYTTTNDTIRILGLQTKQIDYNDLRAVESAVKEDHTCKVFYIQHARQQPTDTYDLKSVIHTVKSSS